MSAALLDTIVAASRRSVECRMQARPLASLAASIRREPRGARFTEALAGGEPPRVIAECKRRSPSRGILRDLYDPAAHAAAYERAGAAAVSVLTEPTFFDGAPGHLTAVRAACTLPLLRKDFITTEYQVIESAVLGADAVLLIVGAMEQATLAGLIRTAASAGLAALVEVHDRDELARAIDAGAGVIGVNSRNLRTLAVDPGVLERLAPDLPVDGIGVAESGIRTLSDIERLTTIGYSGFLVGERLITQPDPGAALREIRGRR